LESVLNSFLLVFVGEIGDKTQLLTLILVARYARPWTILFGVFIATLLNHAFASWAGKYLASLFNPQTLSFALAAVFIAFAVWVLVPDKEDEIQQDARFGVLGTTIIAFFIAEMGDKTQLATVALGARYTSTLYVTIGSTLGMLASNALAVFLGAKLLAKIPMKWVRVFAAFLFAGFGVAIFLSAIA
jgi:putative Ca2+/H+ antiporter (TMEM165/GDT1 family)